MYQHLSQEVLETSQHLSQEVLRHLYQHLSQPLFNTNPTLEGQQSHRSKSLKTAQNRSKLLKNAEKPRSLRSRRLSCCLGCDNNGNLIGEPMGEPHRQADMCQRRSRHNVDTHVNCGFACTKSPTAVWHAKTSLSELLLVLRQRKTGERKKVGVL